MVGEFDGRQSQTGDHLNETADKGAVDMEHAEAGGKRGAAHDAEKGRQPTERSVEAMSSP